MPRRTTVQTSPALSNWDHLVLAGFQVKTNLQRAFTKWETDFRDQIKNYLVSRPEDEHVITAAGVVKCSLITKGTEPTPNREVVTEAFKNALRNGSIRADEIQSLLDAGVLALGSIGAVIGLLESRGIPGAYMRTPPPSEYRHELRWAVLSPEAENGCGILADVADRVHAASAVRLSAEDIALMMPQVAPPAAPQAPATTTVRPRRIQRAPQTP